MDVDFTACTGQEKVVSKLTKNMQRDWTNRGGKALFDYILQRIHHKVRTGDYVMTLHADEEIAAEELSIFDVEMCVLTGKIVERQNDRQTNETKYRILGATVSGTAMEIVVKFSLTGRVFIITAYSVS